MNRRLSNSHSVHPLSMRCRMKSASPETRYSLPASSYIATEGMRSVLNSFSMPAPFIGDVLLAHPLSDGRGRAPLVSLPANRRIAARAFTPAFGLGLFLRCDSLLRHRRIVAH